MHWETDPTSRAEFIAREKEAWKQLTTTWRSLPDDALMLPGACGRRWSVKDVMNHVAAWQEAALRVIGDLLEGRWGRLGHSTDKFNALQYASDQNRSLSASRRRLNRARRSLLTLLAAVPEDRLLNVFGRQQIGWWAKFSTYGHYSEHIQALTEFRHRISVEDSGDTPNSG